mmetsp:Transcript_19999/g.30761  ORF Transcript_19999/g.30761 Transcript_19999/m.30761 type:complete len:111 (+) Transcript_19999:462-794(+)
MIPITKSPGYKHRIGLSNSSLVQFEKKETMLTRSSAPMLGESTSGFTDTPNFDRLHKIVPMMNIQFPMDYSGVYKSLPPLTNEPETTPKSSSPSPDQPPTNGDPDSRETD